MLFAGVVFVFIVIIDLFALLPSTLSSSSFCPRVCVLCLVVCLLHLSFSYIAIFSGASWNVAQTDPVSWFLPFLFLKLAWSSCFIAVTVLFELPARQRHFLQFDDWVRTASYDPLEVKPLYDGDTSDEAGNKDSVSAATPRANVANSLSKPTLPGTTVSV